MSARGGPAAISIDARGLDLVVLSTRWYPEIVDGLLAGARRAWTAAGVTQVREVRVAGAFELPVVAQAAARAGADAVVALGLVLRGATPHFTYICEAVSTGCLRVSLDTGVPVGFGVLTCDSLDQARERAGLVGSPGDKGFEATSAALEAALAVRALGPR